MDEVGLFKSKHMHRHLTCVQIHTECCGCLHQFLQCGDIVFLHQKTENLGSESEEIKTACRCRRESAHQKPENLCQKTVPDKTSAFFLFDRVQSPECEEYVDFVLDVIKKKGYEAAV